MPTYQEEIKLLQMSGFRPKTEVSVSGDKETGLRKETVMGLQIDCSPMLMDKKIKEIENILGTGYFITKFTNDMYLFLTKKGK